MTRGEGGNKGKRKQAREEGGGFVLDKCLSVSFWKETSGHNCTGKKKNLQGQTPWV